MKKSNLILLSVLIPVVLSGCVSPMPERARIFFPALPDKPRIEFKGIYRSQHDFKKEVGQLRKELILGQEPPLYFSRPIDVTSCGDGKVYVSDTAADRVFIYNFNRKTVTFLTGGGAFDNPTGLAKDKDCNLYVVNTKKNKVYVYDASDEPKFSFGGPEIFAWPAGIAVDDVRDRIYVTDNVKHTLFAFNKAGKLLYSVGEGEKSMQPTGFNYPIDVDVASDGRVLVADMMGARIKMFSSSGEYIGVWGERGDGPSNFGLIKGIAIDNDDNVYVTDSNSSSIKIFTVDGTPLSAFGGGYKASAGVVAAGGFDLISGIDVDQKNGIYVADQLNKCFQSFQFLDDEYLKTNPLPVYSPDAIKKGKGWDEK